MCSVAPRQTCCPWHRVLLSSLCSLDCVLIVRHTDVKTDDSTFRLSVSVSPSRRQCKPVGRVLYSTGFTAGVDISSCQPFDWGIIYLGPCFYCQNNSWHIFSSTVISVICSSFFRSPHTLRILQKCRTSFRFEDPASPVVNRCFLSCVFVR